MGSIAIVYSARRYVKPPSDTDVTPNKDASSKSKADARRGAEDAKRIVEGSRARSGLAS